MAARRDQLWLGVIFAAALLVRVIVLWQLSRNDPGFFDPSVDSRWHLLWAKQIASGDWLGKDVFYRAPLYPYLLGLWIKLFGAGIWPIKLAQAVIGAVTAWLVCLVGAKAFGRRVGLIAGCAWVLYGPMIYYETELLIEIIVVPLTLAAIWMAMRAHGEGVFRPWSWLAVGLVLGLTAIARPNILLTVPAFWLWAWTQTDRSPGPWLRRLRGAVFITVGLFIPILPVTARNLVVGRDAVLISYQGGVNFYLGNNPVADGLTMRMPEVSLDESVEWNEFVRTTDSTARALAKRPLRPSEISSFWTARTWKYIRNHPGQAADRLLRKTYYLFNGYEVGDQTDIYAQAQNSWLLSGLIWHVLVFFPFGLIGAVALAGLVFAWRASTRTRPITVFVLLYALTVIGFLVTARHRLPIVSLLVILAAAAIRHCWVVWKSGDRKQAMLLIAIVVLFAVPLNSSGLESILANPAFTYYQRGIIYDRKGEIPEAIEMYETALRLNPGHLASQKNLAYDLVRQKECDSALAVSEVYLRSKPEDVEAINNLGLAHLCLGDTAKAEATFRDAARINPALPHPNFNIAEIARVRGNTAMAVRHYRYALMGDSSFSPAAGALALLYAEANNLDEAIALLERAVRLSPDYLTGWANLGAVLLRAGRPVQAIPPLRFAAERQPWIEGIRMNLAVALLRADSLDAGAALLRDILARNPQNASAKRLLDGVASIRSGTATP